MFSKIPIKHNSQFVGNMYIFILADESIICFFCGECYSTVTYPVHLSQYFIEEIFHCRPTLFQTAQNRFESCCPITEPGAHFMNVVKSY